MRITVVRAMVKIPLSTEETRKQFNRAKKGISPVVATVILVAVAVVIAAALAGFSSSLFGTYSSTGSVSIRTMTFTVTSNLAASTNGLNGEMTIVNKGAAADSVLSMSINPNVLATPVPGTTAGAAQTVAVRAIGPIWHANAGTPVGSSCGTAPFTPAITAADAPSIPANSETVICFQTGQTLTPLTAGQQVTLQVSMKSGVQLTQSVTISP